MGVEQMKCSRCNREDVEVMHEDVVDIEAMNERLNKGHLQSWIFKRKKNVCFFCKGCQHVYSNEQNEVNSLKRGLIDKLRKIDADIEKL